VWRILEERFTKSYIRLCWKEFSNFIFWVCFSYDKKSPCHIWKPEIKTEKVAVQKEIDKLNKKLEPILHQEWELNTQISRLDLHNKPLLQT
jgi:hypothetical protein